MHLRSLSPVLVLFSGVCIVIYVRISLITCICAAKFATISALSCTSLIILIEVPPVHNEVYFDRDLLRELKPELDEYLPVENQMLCIFFAFILADMLLFQPQNILLTDALPDGDIKLCDFGLARPFNCGDDIVELVGTLDYVGKFC